MITRERVTVAVLILTALNLIVRFNVTLPTISDKSDTSDASQNRQDGNKTATHLVGIAVVSDERFQKLQEPLFQTHRAYARTHGYEYHVLEPSTWCRQALRGFFFQKHCTVRQFLSQQAPNYTLFVMDGDVITAAPNVTLDRWLNQDTEVLLYERSWNFEITAGNYMVRNTPFGKHFLHTWEQYDFKARNITGFHSSDNGAIHLVVLNVIESIPHEEYAECERLYLNLTSDVSNLTEYYTFVACTRRVLGPNRHWQLRNDTGTLTIAHRYHGFAIDGYIVNRKPGGAIPFYHGEKQPSQAVKSYNNTAPFNSAEEQSLAIHETHFVKAKSTPFSLVPRIDLSACLPNFTCKVASMNGEPGRDTYKNNNGTLVFEYSALYGVD